MPLHPSHDCDCSDFGELGADAQDLVADAVTEALYLVVGAQFYQRPNNHFVAVLLTDPA